MFYYVFVCACVCVRACVRACVCVTYVTPPQTAAHRAARQSGINNLMRLHFQYMCTFTQRGTESNKLVLSSLPHPNVRQTGTQNK